MCEHAQSCLTLCNPTNCSLSGSLSMGFSRQEYWSGLPFPSPGDHPDPGIKPRSPALQADSLPSELQGRSYNYCRIVYAAAAKLLQSCPTLCDPIDWTMQPTRLPRPWDSPGKNTGVGCHFLLQYMKVKSKSEAAQSCPTLSNSMDCSPPGSPVPGILQARTLEWVAISFSNT